jgi:hypothetical protein
MLRKSCLVLLSLGIAWYLCYGSSRADFDADLLKKFQAQNKTAAEALKQDAARLLAQGTSLDPAPLRKLLAQLHDDILLSGQERAALIRKIQDRVRDCQGLAEKKFLELAAAESASANDTFKRRGQHSGSSFAGDPNIRVKQGVFVAISPGGMLVPDGGVRVLGGSSYVVEARNEYGVPILGGIPYLSRGFRNVGTSRISGGIQISVSVRIINMEEEEAKLLGR